MSKLIFFLYLIFSLTNSLIVEIDSDFDLNIEYHLEKQETGWSKRGKLTFKTKDPSTYKSTISLVDFNFSPQMKKEIQEECKLKGNYILQFTNNKNISERYYTSINPCALISSNFHDKLIINSMTPIEHNKIKSINYMADEDFEEEFDDEEIDDEEIVKKKKGKKGFTKIELTQMKKLDGPIFAEEDDGTDEKVKRKKEEQNQKPPQSILGRYWYIIAIVMFMLMMQGNQEPQQGGQGQGQGHGQGQGEGQGEAK